MAELLFFLPKEENLLLLFIHIAGFFTKTILTCSALLVTSFFSLACMTYIERLTSALLHQVEHLVTYPPARLKRLNESSA